MIKINPPCSEVVDHFVVGYDEANMIANADGTVKIVGEFGRRKHEKIVSDCQASSPQLFCE